VSAQDRFDEKLDIVFIAAAEKRGYARGLIDGYKLAFTDIWRWYEERLKKLISGVDEAEVAPVATTSPARRKRPRGRPEEDDLPHVGEMVRTIIRDGNTFWDSKAVSKAANQAAEGVPRRHEKKRKDVAKTLRYKFEKTLQELKHLGCADSLANFARLSIRLSEELSEERQSHAADILAKLNMLQQEIDDSLRGLLEMAQELSGNRQKKN
jgi:hypothetical protein